MGNHCIDFTCPVCKRVYCPKCEVYCCDGYQSVVDGEPKLYTQQEMLNFGRYVADIVIDFDTKEGENYGINHPEDDNWYTIEELFEQFNQ